MPKKRGGTIDLRPISPRTRTTLDSTTMCRAMIRAFKKELLLPNGDITMYADIPLFLISVNNLVRNDVALEICSYVTNFKNCGLPVAFKPLGYEHNHKLVNGKF